MGFAWFLHFSLSSKNACLSLAADWKLEGRPAEVWLWYELWQVPEIQTLVWPWDRGWARQHRCSCYSVALASTLCVLQQPTVLSVLRAPSTLLDLATALLRGLGFALERHKHFIKKNLTKTSTKTHEIFDPLFLCSHHRQYPEKPYKWLHP